MGMAYGFHLLSPFPGTEIRKTMENYDMRLLTKDWSQYHANRAIVASTKVSKKKLDDIVINWEDEFHAYLDDIKKKMTFGTATVEEKAQIKGLEGVTVIYDLMMNRVIERRGAWTQNGRKGKPDTLRDLIKRISTEVDHSEDKITTALRFCMEQNYLRLKLEENQIKWEWVDYISADSL